MATLAPALTTLLAQINTRFPTRSKASDGWIGDAAHAAKAKKTGDPNAAADASQHNPNAADVVCAIDVTEDLAVGLDCNRLMDELDAGDDPRLAYLIHDAQIDNTDDSRTPYRGANAHRRHLHISVPHRRPARYNDARPWAVPMLGAPAAPPRPAPGPATPALPPAPAWVLPAGHWLGNVAGGATQHGGIPHDSLAVQELVLHAQRVFVATGCVPGVSDWRSGWADRKWEAATDAACRRWFARHRPDQKWTDRVYRDDFAVLARSA